MDELTMWQIGEAARQAREVHDWAESSAVKMATATIEQFQMSSYRDLVASAENVVAIVRELDFTIDRAMVEFQATYGEVIAVFARLHQVYAGVGATFTVTSDKGGMEGATTYERLLSLPAVNAAEVGGELSLSGHVEAKVIKGSASATLDDVTSSATGQIIEASVSIAGTSALSANATVINHHSSWSLERSENSDGQHVFVIRCVGGEETRRKVDILAEVAQEVMNGKVTAQSSCHMLTAQSSRSNADARSVANEFESSLSMDDIPPWDRLPDYRWDRRAVNGLWTGLTDPEIAATLDHVDAKTVSNRLSVLRQQYPAHVPTRDELRKLRSLRKLG